MTTTRPYRMTARADSAAATRERIITATADIAQERLTIEITLDEVAQRAGTSVQTVLRHFGNRDGLLDATITATAAEVAGERSVAAGDVGTALRVLIEHYERRGDFMIRMVVQEGTDARIRSVTESGRRLHREWVAGVFAAALDDAADPEALLDLLVVSTDLAVWKVLRREMGHERATTEARIRALVDLVLAGTSDKTTKGT